MSDEEVGQMRPAVGAGTLPTEPRSTLGLAWRTSSTSGSNTTKRSPITAGKRVEAPGVLQRRDGFDPEEHRRFTDRLIATIHPEFFRKIERFGLPTELPIFIVGMPRSGTTLVEQILASHPQVYGAGELLTCPTRVELGRSLLPPEELSR